MELRIEYDDLEIHGFDIGGTEIMYYQGVPFTGIITTTKNNILCGESEYQNGYKNGMQRDYYYPSGNLKAEYTVIDNSFDGFFKRYDEQEKLVSQSLWLNGERVD